MDNVIGSENGKLTESFTPNYSVLTTDIGTNASSLQTNNNNPVQYYKGKNLWKNTYDVGMELYDKRYNNYSSSNETLSFLPKYPITTTLSGEFVDNGPTPANSVII